MKVIEYPIQGRLSEPSEHIAQQIQNYLRVMDELIKYPSQDEKRLIRLFTKCEKRRASYIRYKIRKGII